MNRRQFLRSSGASLAAFQLAPNGLLPGAELSPNEKLNIAGMRRMDPADVAALDQRGKQA